MTYGLDVIAPFKSSRRHESGEAAAGPSASVISLSSPQVLVGVSLSLFPQIFRSRILRIGKTRRVTIFRVSAQNRRHGLLAGWFVVAVPDAGYRR